MTFGLLLLLAASYVLSAVFSGSETALVTLDRIRLKRRLAEGPDRKARLVERLLDDPERMLGITLVGTNLATATCTAVATKLALLLIGQQGVTVATAVMTPLILVGAEIFPKAYAVHHALAASLAVAPFLRLASWVLFPLIAATSVVTRFLRRGESSAARDLALSREEVFGLLRESERGGVLDEEDLRMARQVLDFRSRRVRDIMVPAEKMAGLVEGRTVAEARRLVVETGYSRIPVTDRAGREVLGVLVAGDLLGEPTGGSIEPLVRSVLCLRPDAPLGEALEVMRRTQGHLAVVREGETLLGMVTLEDVLEVIVGEIRDEHDRDVEPRAGTRPGTEAS